MRLPEHAFDRIRLQLGLPEVPTNEQERESSGDPDRAAVRREPRWRLTADVPVARYGMIDGVLRTVCLRDFSAVGVCIVTSQQFAVGDRFVIYLPWAAEESVSLVCAVKTARVKSDGRFRIGAAFVEASDAVLRQRGRVRAANSLMGEAVEGEWARVVRDPRKQAPDKNPRRHERRSTGNTCTIYTFDDGDKRGPLENVQARDFSDGGVAILRGEPMGKGQRFVIHLPLPGSEPVNKLCRVAHVTLSNNRYLIGAEFIPFPKSGSDKGLTKRIRKWLGVEA
jgi:PilZ domain